MPQVEQLSNWGISFYRQIGAGTLLRDLPTRSARGNWHMRRLLIAVSTIILAVSTLSCDAFAVTLQFWHTWPHTAQTVHALAARYTKQTGVAIQIRVMPS